MTTSEPQAPWLAILSRNGRLDPEAAHRKALASVDRLPVFSPVVQRLMASLNNEDVSFGSVAEMIEKDTMMTASLLRMVNSVLYSRGREINSVRRAVSVLGLTKLRNFAVSLFVAKMWSKLPMPPSFSLRAFNLHSVATATMADLLAQHLPVESNDGAFAAGLLHDMGKLLVAVALPEEFDMLARSGGWEAGLEAELVGAGHAALGREVLDRWRLPADICAAVAQHHNPPAEGEPLTLASLVSVSDKFANGYGAAFESQNQPPADNPLMGIGIDHHVQDITTQFEIEFQAIRQAF